MNNFYSIAIDTYNHQDWIERCLNTCLTQKHDNYEVILVDAISTDRTYDIAKEYAKSFSNLRVYQNEIQIPQVANFLWLTELSRPNSIVVSIDGDDWFKNNRVLETLDKYYTDDVWMTYGSYEEYPYRDVSWHYHAYPEDVINNNSFREHAWLASHLRTWRRELFLKINQDDLKREDGQWLDTTGDVAVMLPMAEMAEHRSRFIPEVTYVYNVSNQSRDSAKNEARQIELSNYIRAKPKYTALKSLE